MNEYELKIKALLEGLEIQNIEKFMREAKVGDYRNLGGAYVSAVRELIEDEKPKPIWSDYYLNKYRWYRKCRKQTWYKHQFTNDALELSITFTGTWWALYGKINRYSDVVDTEVW